MTDTPVTGFGRWLFGRAVENRAAAATPSDHLDDETVAALLETDRGAPVAPEILNHLSHCDACRTELIEQWRDLASLEGVDELPEVPWQLERPAATTAEPARSGSPLAWLKPAPALSAAAAVLVLSGVALLVPWSSFRDASQVPLRSEPAPVTVELVRPAGEVPASDPLVFEWTEVAGHSGYELVVVDPAAAGETVLRLSTTSATHELTPDERSRLAAGHTYEWFVRVELGERRTRTTPTREFKISD